MHSDEQNRLDAWMGLVSAHAKVMRVLEPALKHEHQLTGAQYEILRRLVHAPERRLRMKVLSETILYGSGATTNLVKRLVERGLVVRGTDENDARGVCIEITEEGADLINRARNAQKELSVSLLPAFASDEERDAVLSYLERVAGGTFERIPYLPQQRTEA